MGVCFKQLVTHYKLRCLSISVHDVKIGNWGMA